MSFRVYPQADACRAWMPTTPLPPSISPPSPPMVCHMPKGHDGQHSNERRPTTLSRRWDGDARPPKPESVTAPDPIRARLDELAARALPAAPGLVTVVGRDFDALQAAVRAVLDKHVPWYEVNGLRHDHSVVVPCTEFADCDGDEHRDCDASDGDGHEVPACSECRWSDGDLDGYLLWPCPTVRAIAAALTGKSS